MHCSHEDATDDHGIGSEDAETSIPLIPEVFYQTQQIDAIVNLEGLQDLPEPGSLGAYAMGISNELSWISEDQPWPSPIRWLDGEDWTELITHGLPTDRLIFLEHYTQTSGIYSSFECESCVQSEGNRLEGSDSDLSASYALTPLSKFDLSIRHVWPVNVGKNELGVFFHSAGDHFSF